MDLKKLFEKAKKTKKDGAKISVPEFFVGEIILNDTLFETSQDGSSAFASSACTGQVDINLKKADVIVNGTTYKGLPVNVIGFDDEFAWSINFNDVNVWNIAPIAVMVLIDSEGYCTDYTMIATPEEGEYTISIKADVSGRVMKLHGASRTYSHTAEPRNVKSSEAVKDWPIKKETAILVDEVFSCDADSTIPLIPWDSTSEDFLNKVQSVTVNGTEAEKTDWGFLIENEVDIYVDEGYVYLYSYNGGTYQVKISEEQIVVAEDFKEAVNMVGGGGETNTQMYQYDINNITSTTIYAHSRDYVTLQFLSVNGITPEMINQYLDVGGIEHNSNCCICSYTAKFIEDNVNVYVYLYNPTDNDITFSPGEVRALLYSKYMIEALN